MEPIMVATDVGLKEVQGIVIQPDENLQHLRNKLDEVQTELKMRKQELSELFGVEQQRKNQLDQWIAELETQESLLKQKTALFSSPYTSWISLEPLRWRNEETKLPSLALFSLGSPTVMFSTSYTRADYQLLQSHGTKVFIEKYVPDELKSQYDDLKITLANPPYAPSYEDVLNSQHAISLIMSASFEGIIPSEVRAKIKRAIESKIFDRILLLCEVQKWGIEYIIPAPTPVNIDPIVVGWHKLYPDRLWYIDAFDISPLENRIPIVI